MPSRHPLKKSSSLPGQLDGDNVGSFQISPDGTQVAFVGAFVDTPTGQRTFVGGVVPGPDLGSGVENEARIGANTLTEVTPSNSGDVDDGLRWTPDGLSVITRYDLSGNNEFYLVPADGSANTGVTAPQQLTFGSTNAFDVQISSDGSRIFYGDDRPGAMGSLFTTPIAGASATSAIQLNPGGLSEHDTGAFAQVGSDILFKGFSTPVIGAGNADREDTIYRTAADGSTATTPTAIPITNFPTDMGLNLFDFQVTPDGQTIVARGDLTTDGDTQLYTLPTAGGDFEALFELPLDDATGLPRNNFDVNSVYTISNDGTMVAFVSDFLTNGVGEAYIVDIEGGTPRRVSDSALFAGTGQDVAFDAPPRLQFSADDQFLFYVADGGSEGNHDGTFTLHRVSTAVAVPEPVAALPLLFAASTFVLRRRRR